MPVEFQVDSLDSVDESIRSAYVETDGKFTLDADKYADVKAQGLKNKNKELIGKLKAKEDGLKRFEKLQELSDDDLSELLELRETKGQKPDGKPQSEEAKQQFEKLLKKEKDKHASELSAHTSKLGELEREIKHYKLTVPIRDIAVKAGVIAEDLELVLLDTAKRFALNDDNKIVVLDEDGDVTDITPQKFFETLYKEQRPKFYSASGAGGSGAPSSSSSTRSGGARIITRSQWEKLTPMESTRFFSEGGVIKD
jgi:hypothetical protein